MAPENGSLDPEEDQYVVDDVVTFNCDDGFELVGSRKLTCQTDGEWTDDEPTCEREFGRIFVISFDRHETINK